MRPKRPVSWELKSDGQEPTLLKPLIQSQSYPKNLTTNSEDGVVSYKTFYPVFAAMEEIGLTLNIHGEASSNCCDNITVMNAENAFLPTLKELHQNFPKLKIVMEHVTTAEACEWIKSCDANVVGTITAHHLSLVVDDWAGNVVCSIILECMRRKADRSSSTTANLLQRYSTRLC